MCILPSPLVPPACLLDPSLGTHEYVTANGLKFHCVTAGDKSKPLMLFVHGFPEVQWPFKVLLCSVRAVVWLPSQTQIANGQNVLSATQERSIAYKQECAYRWFSWGVVSLPEGCHGKNGPIQILSQGPNMAAIFSPRTEFCCQIWSHSAIFGPAAWDQIWQQYSVLGPNPAVTFCPRTKYGSNILS